MDDCLKPRYFNMSASTVRLKGVMESLRIRQQNIIMVITLGVLSTFLVCMCISNKIQSNDLRERIVSMEKDISSVDLKLERLNVAFFKCHMANKITNLYEHVPEVGDIHFGQQNMTFR